MVEVIYPSIDRLLNIVDSKYKLVHIAADRAKVMKEYKDSNHKYNVLYALPRIKQHSISCKYYQWCAATYIHGEWEDLLKIDGKYYEITDKTIKKV